jgi:alpha-galactosidase
MTMRAGRLVSGREKYPNGLAPVINHVKNLGMEFGIWVEPEMINPDSDLYRAHPDWVLALPGYSRRPDAISWYSISTSLKLLIIW